MLKNRSKNLDDTKNECFINGVCYKCRTCFDPVRSVYSLKEECSKTKSWRELLREVPQLQTNDEELLPNNVCSKCLDKINKCYEFMLQINNANKKYLELLANSKDPLESNCLNESAIDLPMDQTFLPEIKIEKVEENEDDDYDIPCFINKELKRFENLISYKISDDADDNFADNIIATSIEFRSSSSSDEWEDTPATSKQITDESDFGEIQKVNGRFICPACNKSYSSKKNCRRHIHYLHLKRDNFPCGFCEMSFVCKDYLYAHLRRMHPGETLESNGKQIQQISGISTEEEMKTEQELQNENIKQNKSSSDTKEIQNPTANNLVNTATITNKALCPFCGATFSNNHNLEFHIRRHTGERPFKCDFCEKAFTRNADLKEHRRTHTGERPFQCPHCEKAFKTASKLTVHKRLHTGERPYKCTFCEKRFNTSENQKLHMRLHTGEKPYKCEICDEAFACPRYLKKHRVKEGHFIEKK